MEAKEEAERLNGGDTTDSSSSIPDGLFSSSPLARRLFRVPPRRWILSIVCSILGLILVWAVVAQLAAPVRSTLAPTAAAAAIVEKMEQQQLTPSPSTGQQQHPRAVKATRKPSSRKPTRAPTHTPSRKPTTAYPTTLYPTHRPTTAMPSFSGPAFVSQTTCIPNVCKKRPSFVAHRNFTLLASFPGSGNTWTRTILESGTKLWTGSMYSDGSLYRDGFMGETLDPFAHTLSTVSAIKTHYPYYGMGGRVHSKVTAAVVVMRSPFDAILAEFTRRNGRGANHRSVVDVDTLLNKFPAFFSISVAQWTKFSRFWVAPSRRSDTQSITRTEHGVTSIEYVRPKLVKSSTGVITPDAKGIRVLVLFYEDFIRNEVATVLRLNEFIKDQLQRRMPTTAEEATTCVIAKGRRAQSRVKRPHKKDEYNVYKDSSNQVAKRDMVRTACKKWKTYWRKEVWGDCLDPMPQSHRLQYSTAIHDRLGALEEYCDGQTHDDVLKQQQQLANNTEEEHETGSDYAEGRSGLEGNELDEPEGGSSAEEDDEYAALDDNDDDDDDGDV